MKPIVFAGGLGIECEEKCGVKEHCFAWAAKNCVAIYVDGKACG